MMMKKQNWSKKMTKSRVEMDDFETKQSVLPSQNELSKINVGKKNEK